MLSTPSPSPTTPHHLHTLTHSALTSLDALLAHTSLALSALAPSDLTPPPLPDEIQDLDAQFQAQLERVRVEVEAVVECEGELGAPITPEELDQLRQERDALREEAYAKSRILKTYLDHCYDLQDTIYELTLDAGSVLSRPDVEVPEGLRSGKQNVLEEGVRGLEPAGEEPPSLPKAEPETEPMDAGQVAEPVTESMDSGQVPEGMEEIQGPLFDIGGDLGVGEPTPMETDEPNPYQPQLPLHLSEPAEDEDDLSLDFL
ncbi:hypothetical protein HK104_005725 [Borealophlyctis nickersoniae]|nr:hypothetical protein HK104_005725 [Borealophlyctis nickersoniae]